MNKDLARIYLGESLDARYFTANVAEAILVLLGSEDKELTHALKKLVNERDSLNMGTEYRRPDRLSESDLVGFKNFFKFDDEELELKLGSEVGDNEYFMNAVSIVEQSFVKLGFDSSQWTPTEALIEWTEFKEQNQDKWKKDKNYSMKVRKKALRFLARIQEFLERYDYAAMTRDAQMMSKSRFANRINYETLSDEALSFVAYLTARAGRRSVFAFRAQSRAFDEIHEKLFKIVEQRNISKAEWGQIAFVYPVKAVLKHLDDSQLSSLASDFRDSMERYAEVLEDLWDDLPATAKSEMACYKGADTHNWNIYAGAFNTARSAVLSIDSAGAAAKYRSLPDLKHFPGKAVRLMTLDLMRGFSYQNEPNVESFSDKELWAELPFPWEILNGDAVLPVEKLKGNPGWVGPFANVETEEIKAETPLANGVIIEDAELAEQLRKAGFYK